MLKRIIVLGATGMAGSTVCKFLKLFPDQLDIFEVSRDGDDHFNIDVEKDMSALIEVIDEYAPDYIINCIGLLVKDSNANVLRALAVNSFFPHFLENCTQNTDIKVIHLSTDCIYDGNSEFGYDEKDIPTERNWYGRTKAIGEINNSKDLTLRMSIIGPELTRKTGLLEWFLSQNNECSGYDKAVWNGITTLELAKQIKKIIVEDINISGVYNLVPNETITKYELLKNIAKVFNKEIKIVRDSTITSNKVLKNTRVNEYNPLIPSYDNQLRELKRFIELNK